jgi:phage repressor protein C with HTH and peptisase S24 domain
MCNAMDEKKLRANRLKRAREEAGFDSAAAFADAADVPEATYRSYENGTRTITDNVARQLARHLPRPWHWILFGDELKEASELPATAGEPVNILSPRVRDARMVGVDELDLTASAGAGGEVGDVAVLHRWRVPRDLAEVATDSPIESIKLLRVKGDSMVPTYSPVDRVMVDTADRIPSPEGVFVVWDGLGFVIKRIRYLPHSDPPTVRMSSDNTKYDPYDRVLGEAYIQGRVIGKWLWT